jgi:hypothetical protein
MTATLRFVDAPIAARTTLLDLNDRFPFAIDNGWDFPPPPLRTSFTGSLLSDGQALGASAYDNREITLPLTVLATTVPALATALTKLHRLLNQDSAWLEFKRDASLSTPVFFRVLRSPAYETTFAQLWSGTQQVTLTLTAEPFAIGLEQTALPVTTINNDPAAVTNPMSAAITGILGDVPAPMLMKVIGASSNLVRLGIRSRGVTPQLPFFGQAETSTLGTDTTSQAIAGFSAGNGARVSFATVATLATRLTTSVFGPTASDGEYRIIARVARNGGAATDDFQLRGFLGGYGSTVTVSNLTGPQLVDLGVFAVGGTATGGYGSPFISSGDSVIVQAARTSGTGSLDIDYVLAIPADTAYLTVDFGTFGTSLFPGWIDGVNDTVYTTTNGGGLVNVSFSRVGSIPQLVPNQTNWIYLVRSASATSDTLGSTTLSATYWPRYLYVAA